jgi:hypothetical protein
VDRRFESGEQFAGERAVESSEILRAGRMQQAFGRKIACRGVVLMERVHGDARGCGPGCLRQGLAERVVPLITDPEPIDRTQYNRFAGTQQYDSSAAEPQLVHAPHGIVSHHRA